MHPKLRNCDNRTFKPLPLMIFIAATYGYSAVWAASGAHEHGAAELQLSSEGKDVQITFIAPAQSLVGFETAAVTAEQKAAVERAEALLMEPSALFVLEGNSCELIDAIVDVSSIEGVAHAPSQQKEHADHAEEHADHKHEHSTHEGEHADHKGEHAKHEGEHAEHGEDHADNHVDHHDHQSHSHEHEHHDHDDDGDTSDAGSHSDVSATYTFECDSDKALTRLAFQGGSLPFGLERIDVYWVADWGQGANQATPQSPLVNLRN